MTCAKKQVRCVITGNTGERFVGTNDCANPQAVCPRLPGEGYEKCKTVCQQDGHAEIMALRAAGAKAAGGTAVVYGHGYACRHCQEALFTAGIVWLGVAP